MSWQLNMFSEAKRLDKLSKLGDSLEQLDKLIDFEMFRKEIRQSLYRAPKGPGGRPAFDVITMFKILVIQRLYNLSDDEMEFQLNDRITFMRFAGLKIGDTIPDAKTIWLYRDTLSKVGIIEKLFAKFNSKLEKENLITRTGSIIDATFVEVPKQRNSREENKKLKEDKIPEEWKENPNKLSQKDTEAKWTIKNNTTYYGYKNNIKADSESKLITAYTVTSANVHDNQELNKLVDEKDNAVYADKGYYNTKENNNLPSHVKNRIMKKGYGKRVLTEEEKFENKIISKIRCRIEHIFGFMTNKFRGLTIRSIGMKRAKFNIGLINLLYNLFRYSFLVKNPILIG